MPYINIEILGDDFDFAFYFKLRMDSLNAIINSYHLVLVYFLYSIEPESSNTKMKWIKDDICGFCI